MAIYVFAYVSGEESSFQMVGDDTLLLIDAVSTEIGVISQDRLCCVWSALSL